MNDNRPQMTALSQFRTTTLIYALCTIGSSWWLMQVFHEGGHAAAAWLTGGTAQRVVLVPWQLSRTDLGQNPRPLFVAWAGPVMGVIFPVSIWLLARSYFGKGQQWFRFLAGFCLIANGAYIGFGSLTGEGDAGDMLREGSPAWTMWVFAAAMMPAGLLLWHRLGPHFGMGRNRLPVSWSAAVSGLVLTLTIITIESIVAALFQVNFR